MADNLFIMNVTRSEIQRNRQTINGLITALEDSQTYFKNVTASLRRNVLDLHFFTTTYLQADLLIQEMRETNDRSVSYLNTINQQLNAFASGNIPQSIIPPGQLRNSLLTISRQLPPTMT